MSEAKDLIKKMCDLQNSDPEIQKALAGWSGVVQYDISGEKFYVEYAPDGKCAFKEGTHPSPKFTIIATSDFWVRALRGQEDLVASFMMGKYKIQGNIMEAQRLGAIVKKFQSKYKL